jgi:hypothetical protein
MGQYQGIDMDDLDKENLYSIQAGDFAKADINQQRQIAHLTKHVRALWNHIERLERVVAIKDGQVVVKSGDASIVLKRDGSILIKGKDIAIEAWGKITMKGSKIQEN